MKKISLLILAIIGLVSCNNTDDKADGYGNFEATEITVSAEANGKIEFLKLEEGDSIQPQTQVGLIDTLQLYFSKQLLLANKGTIASKSANILSQKSVLEAQLKTVKAERNRIHAMYAENAATKRQVDEIDGRLSVIEQQIQGVYTQNAPILNELKSLNVQIEKINDQIQKSKIINPISGTVLTKYAEPGELTAFGKPLYKIADLSEMILRVFVSEAQLEALRIGKQVLVKIDSKDQMKTYNGRISWIASQAEFTPKIIQTKEERINLVYAVKIRVLNDGSLKIGMPAEMWLK